MKKILLRLLLVLLTAMIAACGRSTTKSSAGDDDSSKKNFQKNFKEFCLLRTNPLTGKKEGTTVYSSKVSGTVAPEVWDIKAGEVDFATNHFLECTKSTSGCYVDAIDTFTVSLPASTYKYARNYRASPTPEAADMFLDADGVYLSGSPVNWLGTGGSSKSGEIFLLFQGYKPNCVVIGGPPGKDCYAYALEIYPDSASPTWDVHKPSKGDVKDVPCSEAGLGSPQQPGGGGGHDPPP